MRILVALSVLFALSMLQAAAADRVALVIGNNAYPTKGGNLPPLKNCVPDAKLMRDTLKGLDFEVTYLENANRSEMDEALLEWEKTIPKGGTAVVYFAGHGIEYEKRNYLMGCNAKFQAASRLGEEAMNAETFAIAMLQAGAGQSFLFLDCCREKPDLEWATRNSRTSGGLEDMKVVGDIIISFAAQPGKLAQDRPMLERRADGTAVSRDNGPYAQALAKWLPEGLKHGEVLQKVRVEVNTLTQGEQRTWETGSFLTDFYFAPPKTEPETEVAVTPPSSGSTMARPTPGSVPLPVPPGGGSGGGGFPAEVGTRGFTNSLGMEFVPVAGTEVQFCVHETRVQDFRAFVAGAARYRYEAGETPYTLDKDRWKQREGQGFGWDRPGFEQGEEHAVTCVSWEDAKAFCAWLSQKEGRTYRLPTDHEWSVAVGIGAREDAQASPSDKDEKITDHFPWGGKTFPPPQGGGNYGGEEFKIGKEPDSWTGIAGYRDGNARAAAVKSYGKNAFGLYDLGGNVWEWCEDKYNKNGNENTRGVLRGGSWYDDTQDILRSSYRFIVTPAERYDVNGFRVVVAVGR